MDKTIIMHIGTAKTGTTAIQNFLLKNVDVLKKEGVEYPTRNIPTGVFAWTDGNIGEVIQDNKLSAKEKAKKIINLYGKYQKVLLSTERIWVELVDKVSFFREFINKGYKIRVIVYLREQAEYLESVYRESVKAGPHFVLSSEQLVDDNCNMELPWRKHIEKGMHYYERLNEIASIIGRENIVVRIYDKGSLKNGSIYEDFLEAIGIENVNISDWIIPEKRINPSLNLLELELMRKLNELRIFYSCPELTRAFFEPISKQASLTEKSIHFSTCFSEKDRHSIYEKYREENLLLSREYLKKETDLFEWKEIGNHNDVINSDDMLEALVHVYGITILDMNRKIDILEKKIVDSNIEKVDMMVNNTSAIMQKKYDEERIYFEKKLLEKQEEINAMKNGYSWKITAPLRKIRRFLVRNNRR